MKTTKGSEVELEIESAAYKGKGVGRIDNIAVFVPGTAPGDRIRAQIVKKKKRYREARLLEILAPSPDRVEPRCRHANECGGCTWQHLPYPIQLSIKEQHVRDHVQRIAGLDPSIVEPILGCDEPFHYRNKMEYSFGTRKWLSREEIEQDTYVDDRGFAAGLHAPGRFDKILDLQECHLQDRVSYRILDTVRNWCIEQNVPAFNTRNNSGFMRHLVVRDAAGSDDLMVNLVTYEDRSDIVEPLTDHLLREFPEITTIVNNINDRPNPTATGRVEHVFRGSGYITDRIGSFDFRISANSFFQTNTLQAEKLYRVARDFTGLTGSGTLYDLYCGVGTLSLFLSTHASRVIGVELEDVAVENARDNAALNGIEHTEFHRGDMKEAFSEELIRQSGSPDCIVTDPPRSGMHPDVVERLKALGVPRLVYISCNPSTMARDLETLKEVYSVERIKPVDMFPQTYHIEAVACLKAGK